jgi:Protein of unknown function
MATEPELDQLLLSFCEMRWLKVARVIGHTILTLEERGGNLPRGTAEAIDARMAVLVGSGQLEAKGNIRNWRYSEVRLPAVLASVDGASE